MRPHVIGVPGAAWSDHSNLRSALVEYVSARESGAVRRIIVIDNPQEIIEISDSEGDD